MLILQTQLRGKNSGATLLLLKHIEDEDEFEDDRENSGSLRFSEVEDWFRRGRYRSVTLPKERPSENYGNEEHTTVAAFLPWRGL